MLLLLLAGPALAQTAPPVIQPQAGSQAQKPKPKPAAPAKPPPAPAPVAPASPPAAPALPPEDPGKGSVTNLPIPRYMSLRFDEVNLRVGPGLRYPIDWVYHRKDLPVQVIRELDDWRLVQDQDNVQGWVRAQTLSPRRGFVITVAQRVLRATASDDAAPLALLNPGVVGHLISCAAGENWCAAEYGTYKGWLKRGEFYGVYAGEAFGG